MAHLNNSPLPQRRGIDCYDVNDAIVLVHSPIQPVTLALNQVLPLGQWRQDIYEREIDIGEQGFVVFQFREHSWTCVHEHSSFVDFKFDNLQALSKLISTRVIWYGTSDTCGSQ